MKEVLISRTQVVNIGVPLRARLEQVAQAEGRDATSLARHLIEQYVEQQERRQANGT